MTTNDRGRFKRAFNALAIAARLPADQAGADALSAFWRGLEAFPIEAVEAAAQHMAETAQWFPKLVDWRAAAVQAQHDQALARTIPPPTRSWQNECGACDDTGWAVLTCDGVIADDGLAPCGRCREHAAHGYVVHCSCRTTNQTYQRHRLEMVRGHA